MKTFREHAPNSLYDVVYTYGSREHADAPHFHENVELLYNITGEKHAAVGNNAYVLRPHNLLVIDSFKLHSYEPSDGKHILVSLPASSCEHYSEYLKNKSLRSNLIDDSNYCKEKILPRLSAVIHGEALDGFSYQANVDVLLSAICAKAGLSEKNNYSIGEARSVIAYIEKNYNKDLSLASISNHFGYSKCYFSRTFNELFGASLNDYIALVRLNRALSYFEKNDCTIAQAAKRCGFGSMPTFYRALKKFRSDFALKNVTTQPDGE